MPDLPTSPPTTPEPPDQPPAAVIRALDIFAALLAVLGSGEHTITCVTAHRRGFRHADVRLQIYEPGQWRSLEPSRKLADLVELLIVSLDEGHRAGIVTRSRYANSTTEALRAWALDGSWPRPLPAREVRAAYATHPVTGEPLPAEPNVHYWPGIPLPCPNQPPT